jgi:hypothetical protein
LAFDDRGLMRLVSLLGGADVVPRTIIADTLRRVALRSDDKTVATTAEQALLNMQNDPSETVRDEVRSSLETLHRRRRRRD